MKYRAEIDGLRAVAVIPVILFHAGFGFFRGGFVGVDIFFVISGYLITTILIDDLDNDHFSLLQFYERRARRILPALLVVIVCCIPFAGTWMLSTQMKDFAQSIVAVSLFASNFLFWIESGYFEADTAEKPLLHTWSLAVEEQFYLLFPLFLLLAWRMGKPRLLALIVFLAAISLGLSEWASRHSPAANFYLAPTRAWELLAGAFAALFINRHGVIKNQMLALAGLATIVLSILLYDETVRFPSLQSVFPVAGAMLIIMFGSQETFAARFLSARLLVGTGLISYSAYLWHQPLFALARIRLFEAPGLITMCALSGAALCLGYLSWKFVELPFRDKAKISRKQIFAFSAISTMLLGSVGLAGHLFEPQFERYWASQQSEDVRLAYQTIRKVDARLSGFGVAEDGSQTLDECRFNARNIDPGIEDQLFACQARYGPGVLILGDSHSVDLFGVVTSRFDDPFIVGFTNPGCRVGSAESGCQYAKVLTFLSQYPKIMRRVIYEQAGFTLLKKGDEGEDMRTFFLDLPMTSEVAGVRPREEEILQVIHYLSELSKIVPVTWFLPRAEPQITAKYILKYGCQGDYFFRKNQFETFTNLDAFITERVESLATSRLRAVSQNAVFDFDLDADFMDCGALYWSDGDHLSADGEVRFGKRLPADFVN